MCNDLIRKGSVVENHINDTDKTHINGETLEHTSTPNSFWVEIKTFTMFLFNRVNIQVSLCFPTSILKDGRS